MGVLLWHRVRIHQALLCLAYTGLGCLIEVRHQKSARHKFQAPDPAGDSSGRQHCQFSRHHIQASWGELVGDSSSSSRRQSWGLGRKGIDGQTVAVKKKQVDDTQFHLESVTDWSLCKYSAKLENNKLMCAMLLDLVLVNENRLRQWNNGHNCWNTRESLLQEDPTS